MGCFLIWVALEHKQGHTEHLCTGSNKAFCLLRTC